MTARKAVPPQPLNELLSDTVDLNREYTDMPFDNEAQEVIETSRQIAKYWGKKEGEDHTLLSFLSEPLVVVLGEARSGKTTEFRLAAKKLQEEGKYAFFIRLEDLPNPAMPHLDAVKFALESEVDKKLFDQWLVSKDEAVFFLDAVDEAKLINPSDFRTAIKVFQSGLNEQLKRTRLFVSCRVTEWHGQEDVDVLTAIKGYLVPSSDNDNPVTGKEPFKFLQILPLDLKQVEALAKHCGLDDAKPFIEEIEKTDALEFVARPGDVKGHVRIWEKKGGLGSFTELVEVDIHEKLKEDNQKYQGKDALTPEKARFGAEILAAASVFCQEPNYRFSSSENEQPYMSAALDIAALLSDWTDTERKALLRRPLFDDATYGRVRLHTRTVREYLAAQWLLKRHKEGCTPADMINLIFAEKYGKAAVIPSRSFIAAWLAPDIPELFDAILKHNPELLPDVGDPARFTAEQKKAIIEAYAKRYKDRQRTGFKYDPQGLARFAHQDLGDIIDGYLKVSNLPEHFKQLLFDIIEVGKISSCAENTLEYALNETEDINIRMYALRTLETCGNEKHLLKLYAYLVGSENLPDRFYARSLHTVYPRVISPEELIELIKQAPEKVTKSEKNFKEWLEVIIGNEKAPDRLSVIIPGLLELVKTPGYSWLYTSLSIAMSNWMENTADDPEWFYETLLLLDGKKDDSLRYSKAKGVKEGFKKLPIAIRQKYFWTRYDELSATLEGNNTDFFLRYRLHGENDTIIQLLEKDIEWLLQNAVSNPDEQKRITAFDAVIPLCREIGGVNNYLDTLQAAADTSKEIKNILDGELVPRQPPRWELRNEVSRLRKQHNRLMLYKEIRENLPSIKDASDDKLFCRVYRCIENQFLRIQGDEISATNIISSLAEKFDSEVKDAFVSGLQTFWRSWKVVTQKNRRVGDKIALLAVQYEAENGFDFSSLKEEEVKNLIRLARKDFWLPKWFSELIQHFPDAVKKQTFCWIKKPAEWDSTAGENPAVLSDIAHASDDVAEFFAPEVLKQAKKNSPIPTRVRPYVCSILEKSSCCPGLEEIADLHLEKGTAEDRLFWLAVLFHLNADKALDWLENHIEGLEPAEADKFVISLCSLLYKDRHSGACIKGKNDYKRVEVLRRFIPLVYGHVRYEDDQTHDGIYTPDSRDDAETFRSNLIGMLADTPGEQAYRCMLDLKDELPEHGTIRDYLLWRSEQRIGIDSDIAWQEKDIKEFEGQHEHDPLTANELFRIGCKRLYEIKYKLETGDYSQRELFSAETHEDLYQKYTAERLEELSRKRYSVVREAEVDQKKEPDIRLLRPDLPPVSIEMKCAHKWGGNELVKQLHNQLVEQYLRAIESRHGVFLLFNAKKGKTWDLGSGNINFDQLIEHLRGVAKEIEIDHLGVECLQVIGIDLTEPA